MLARAHGQETVHATAWHGLSVRKGGLDGSLRGWRKWDRGFKLLAQLDSSHGFWRESRSEVVRG